MIGLQAFMMQGGGLWCLLVGAAIVPGKPDESLLVLAVRRKHDKFKMPPDKALPAHVVTDLERWIAEGAVWTEVSVKKYAKYSIDKNARKFWSFQPVGRPSVPVVSRKEWNRNPIDAFILSRLQKKKLIAGPNRRLLRALRHLRQFHLSARGSRA